MHEIKTAPRSQKVHFTGASFSCTKPPMHSTVTIARRSAFICTGDFCKTALKFCHVKSMNYKTVLPSTQPHDSKFPEQMELLTNKLFIPKADEKPLPLLETSTDRKNGQTRTSESSKKDKCKDTFLVWNNTTQLDTLPSGSKVALQSKTWGPGGQAEHNTAMDPCGKGSQPNPRLY